MSSWALAARLRLEQASRGTAVLMGMGFGVVLLFCHVADFGIYAVMSGGFALAAWLRRRRGLGLLCLRAIELVPATALFLAMSAGHQGRLKYKPDYVLVKLFGIVKSMTSGKRRKAMSRLRSARRASSCSSRSVRARVWPPPWCRG